MNVYDVFTNRFQNKLWLPVAWLGVFLGSMAAVKESSSRPMIWQHFLTSEAEIGLSQQLLFKNVDHQLFHVCFGSIKLMFNCFWTSLDMANLMLHRNVEQVKSSLRWNQSCQRPVAPALANVVRLAMSKAWIQHRNGNSTIQYSIWWYLMWMITTKDSIHIIPYRCKTIHIIFQYISDYLYISASNYISRITTIHIHKEVNDVWLSFSIDFSHLFSSFGPWP